MESVWWVPVLDRTLEDRSSSSRPRELASGRYEPDEGLEVDQIFWCKLRTAFVQQVGLDPTYKFQHASITLGCGRRATKSASQISGARCASRDRAGESRRCAAHLRGMRVGKRPDALLHAIMDALDAHTTMNIQTLGSDKVRAGLKDILLGPAQLYEGLRERALGPVA